MRADRLLAHWQLTLLIGVLLGVASAGAAPLSLFQAGEHCVAYRTKKQLVLIRTVTVVGRSCEVSAQVIPEVGGNYRLEVTFPINSLNSGESERDQDVAKILKAEKQPDVVFRSLPLPRPQWLELKGKGRFQVEGDLILGGTPNRVVAEVAMLEVAGHIELDAVIRTKFRQLRIEPPTLGAGLLARVREDLEIHAHLLGRRTLGFESLIGAESTTSR